MSLTTGFTSLLSVVRIYAFSYDWRTLQVSKKAGKGTEGLQQVATCVPSSRGFYFCIKLKA